MGNSEYRTWIEIDTRAARYNYNTFRKLIAPTTKLLGVVKSNAYGHELMGYAKLLQNFGADFLGVDSITEARTLRNHKVKLPILVLGYTLPNNFKLAAKDHTAITISDFTNLKLLAKFKKKVSIHIKVDTGMHRQGFFVKDLPKVIEILQKNPQIYVEGAYTHFAAAKRPDANHDTEKQIALFKQSIPIIKSKYPQTIFHASATAGTLNYPEAHFDMVRIGIGMYGLWPSEETKHAFSVGADIIRPQEGKMISSPTKAIHLYPVLTWKTIISEIKTLEKGEKIGYDYTESLKCRSTVAIIPVGYWHGYFRAFSSKAYVLVHNKRCKVLGRVAMDMTTVDVTDVPNAKVGDEVVLIGKFGSAEVTADELGALAGTTNYEIVTRLNPLIKKFFL